MRFWSHVLVLLACLAFSACEDSGPTSPTSEGAVGISGGNTSTPNPTTPGGSANLNCANGRGTLTAVVNGVSWTASCVATASWVANVFSLSAVRDAEVLALTVNAGLPGNYNALTGFAGATLTRTTDGATWVSGPGGIVSITLTRLDLQGAAGTFSFTGTPVPGTSASGTRLVTGGTFSVAF